MEINIISEDKQKIEFEIEKEDHTLCNALQDALWKQPNIDVVAYSMDHPLIPKVRMVVSVTKGNPRDIIEKAVDTLKKEAKSMASEFSKKC